MWLIMAEENPLFTEYKQTIPEKIDLIATLISRVKDLQNLESLQELRQAVHKLAGNSGTFGFMKVSNACKTLDIELQDKIKDFKKAVIDADLLKRLDMFFLAVKDNFSKPDINIEL